MGLILTIPVEQIFVDEMLTASEKHENAIEIRDRREERSRDLSERMHISAMQSPHEQKCEEYDKPVDKPVRHCHCCCCDVVVVSRNLEERPVVESAIADLCTPREGTAKLRKSLSHCSLSNRIEIAKFLALSFSESPGLYRCRSRVGHVLST